MYYKINGLFIQVNPFSISVQLMREINYISNQDSLLIDSIWWAEVVHLQYFWHENILLKNIVVMKYCNSVFTSHIMEHRFIGKSFVGQECWTLYTQYLLQAEMMCSWLKIPPYRKVWQYVVRPLLCWPSHCVLCTPEKQ